VPQPNQNVILVAEERRPGRFAFWDIARNIASISDIHVSLTGNDRDLVLEALLDRRQTDGPDVAVERSGSMDLDNSDVVLVSVVLEIPVYPYLRYREIQRSGLVEFREIVLAQSHRDVARIEAETTTTG